MIDIDVGERLRHGRGPLALAERSAVGAAFNADEIAKLQAEEESRRAKTRAEEKAAATITLAQQLLLHSDKVDGVDTAFRVAKAFIEESSKLLYPDE